MFRLHMSIISLAVLLPLSSALGEEAAPQTSAEEQHEPIVELGQARGLAIILSLHRLRQDSPATWRALDLNGDGGLCAAELRPIAGAQAQALVAMFDSDNNQRLDPYEIAFYAAEAQQSTDARTALNDPGQTPSQPDVIRQLPTDPGHVMAPLAPVSQRATEVVVIRHTTPVISYHRSDRRYWGYTSPLIMHPAPMILGPRPAPIWPQRAIVTPSPGLRPITGSAHAGASSLHVTPRRR